MDEQQPPASSPQPAVAPPAPVQPVSEAQDIENNKDIAALSYIWILSVFVYFVKKDSSFVRFHARQAIVLFILSIPIWFIPVIGRFLELVILALAVFGFLAAAQGQRKELPLVGPLARRDKSALRSDWKHIADASVKGWQEASHVMKKETADTAKQTPPTPASTPTQNQYPNPNPNPNPPPLS